MAAVAALLALLGPVSPIPVTVPRSRYVALPFQPVLLRCRFPPVGPEVAPPIVTWKFRAPCAPFNGDNGDTGGYGDITGDNGDIGGYGARCPHAVRIVATKQGDVVTLGDAYRGRGVTITGDADLSLAAAAWGDSGTYVCTVTSTADLSGDNEGHTDLVVLDWLFVVLVLLGLSLGALGLGLCWCQCCPHRCCCLLRCPCCPRRCCCPEALYYAGKAATSGGRGGASGHAPPPIPLPIWGGPHAPLLIDTAPPPSDITSLHEPPDAWVPAPNAWVPPPDAWVPPPDAWVPPPDAWVPPSPPPPSRGRSRSAEFLAGSPRPRPRSSSRDDWLEPRGGVAGGGVAKPRPRPHSPPRRLRKNDALSRESLVV